MIAMPGSRRSTMRLPMLRRRSPREEAIATLRGGLDQGLRTLTETLQEARDAAADARLPDAVGASIRDAVADMPKLPDVSALAADLHAPDLHLRDATRHLRADGLRLPDVRIPDVRMPDVPMPDVRLDAGGLRALGRRAGSARDIVASLPGYRIRREPRSAPTGAILGAVIVGMLGGLWLATWPVTAPRVRTFFESLRSRLGLGDGWSADSARDALHRIEARTGSWRDGPLARRRGRQSALAADIEQDRVAGVAVGPGHVYDSGLEVPASDDDVAVGSVSFVAGSPATPGSPADERIVRHGIYQDADQPGTDGGSIPG